MIRIPFNPIPPCKYFPLFSGFFANFLRKDFFKFFEIKKPPSNRFEEGNFEPLAGIEPATY